MISMRLGIGPSLDVDFHDKLTEPNDVANSLARGSTQVSLSYLLVVWSVVSSYTDSNLLVSWTISNTKY